MTIGERIKYYRNFKGYTQQELADAIGTTKQAIYKYESGIVTNIPTDKIELLSNLFGVSPSHLMGWDDLMTSPEVGMFANIRPVKRIKVPLLGEIACGQPIFANEDRECYVSVGVDIEVDFCLIAKGDSMVGARINDGDIVFLQKTDVVNNGEIAAVIIGDEATLKRVYYYPDKAKLVLNPENPKYEPLVYVKEELNEIHILGRAVAFQSDVV